MLYTCSSRPARWQRGGMIASSRGRRSSSGNLAKVPKPENSRPLPFFELVNTAQSSTRFQGLTFKRLFKTPKEEDSFSLPYFKVVNVNQKSYSLNLRYSRIQSRVSSIKSFALAKNIYRHFEGYPCFTYRNSSKWAVTIGDLKILNQDENYFILSKLEWEGLIRSESNSAEEILAALLLHWQQGKLESRKISVVFYRTLRFQLASEWVETQSFLINALVNDSVTQFPSPRTFLF